MDLSLVDTIKEYPFVLAAVPLAAAALYAINKGKYKDIEIEMPAQKRKDLLFGYYASNATQFAQVRDHTNVIWHAQFYGDLNFIEDVRSCDYPVVLDFSKQLFVKVKNKLVCRDDARQALTDYLNYLKQNGILHRIKYLVPVDEPNYNVLDIANFKKAIDVLKDVKVQFTELDDSKYLCIYGSDSDYWLTDEFDVLGVDCYDQKSQVLTIGYHAKLLGMLKSDQRTVILPGASYYQDPTPFVAYAQAHPEEVEMIIAFFWFYDKNHCKGLGIEKASKSIINKYVQAGTYCVTA